MLPNGGGAVGILCVSILLSVRRNFGLASANQGRGGTDMATNNTRIQGETGRKAPWVWSCVLEIVAICVTAFGLWHRHKIDYRSAIMRQPEVFDEMGLWWDEMTVLVPVFSCWLIMQFAALVVYCSSWRRAGFYAGFVFLSLWLVSLLAMVELLFSPFSAYRYP
jgi:hypothetical protein